MIVSILAEIRFDKSGSVRARTFEVLPTQVFLAGESTQDEVITKAQIVLAFSAIRMICAAFTFFNICLKVRYRSVIGTSLVV